MMKKKEQPVLHGLGGSTVVHPKLITDHSTEQRAAQKCSHFLGSHFGLKTYISLFHSQHCFTNLALLVSLYSFLEMSIRQWFRNKTGIYVVCCILFVSLTAFHFQGIRYYQDFINDNGYNDIAVAHHPLSFSHNSERWLNSPRLQNNDEDAMTHDIVQNLIMKKVSPPLLLSELHSSDLGSNVQTIMNQTMCLQGSKFLDWEYHSQYAYHNMSKVDTEETIQANIDNDDEYIKYLAHRLLYLALHEHQHGPARNEAIARYGSLSNNISDNIIYDDNKNNSISNSTLSSQLLGEKQPIGKFDYECSDTKFIVSNIGGVGFGAAIRLGVPDPLYLGLVSNRTVLFYNSLSTNITNDPGFSGPWPLASCPRNDYQCIYLPISPCTITHDDFRNAPVLSPDVLQSFRKNGVLDEKFKDEKVIIIPGNLNGHKPIPAGLADTFINIISSMYVENDNDISTRILQKVYKHISNLSWWEWHTIALFYILRPNYSARKKIDTTIQNVFPQNFKSETSLGLPIRGEL